MRIPPLEIQKVTSKVVSEDTDGNEMVEESTAVQLAPKQPQAKRPMNRAERRNYFSRRRRALKKAKKVFKARVARAKAKKAAKETEVTNGKVI